MAGQVIWLSDLHFEAAGDVLGHDPRVRLDAAVDHINTHYGDAALCVISGDMVETATAANYTALRAHLDRLSIPWHPMTGNHDDRALLRAHLRLPSDAMDDFAQYELSLPQARLICLDTLCDGADKGWLCAGRLDWLRARLEVGDPRPVLIFAHHPPMPLDLPMLDPDRLENGAALLEILHSAPMVRHLFFGHVHRPVSGSLGGSVGALPYSGLRSVLYQAPPPRPAWDWDSFAPAPEAPELGVITLAQDRISIQCLQFCAADLGVRAS